MEIRLLGVVEANRDGRAVALGGVKQRAVLAMLALHVNRRVSADRLIEGLWGERPPASAPKMVQNYVSQLRRLLDGDEAQIVTRGGGYELRAAPDVIDAARFERLVDEAARGGGAAEAPARDALALWRGPPLDDVADEPFATAAIRRLEDLWLRARELAIEGALASGRHAAVIGELEQLVVEHPLRERLHGQRMLALYRCGRQAEALDAYRQARAVLVEEIGVEPGTELRRLHEAILRQDPALDPLPADPRRGATVAAQSRRAPRALVLVAALVAVAGIAAFTVIRLAARESLGRIDGDSVGLIDPSGGNITAQYGVGHGPAAIAAGGGSVWVANARDGTVSRIDRARDQVVTIDVGGEPTALAWGAGSLWVTDGQNRRLKQVDPGRNRVVNRFVVGNAPRGVAVTEDTVWVASAVDGRVYGVDLARGRSRRPIAIGGGPAALAAGFGAVWVVGEEAGALTRLEPRSGVALKSIAVGNGPAGVAVGEGAVWVANRHDETVSRIDPATDSVTDVVHVGGAPVAIAAGRGAAWVADGNGGTVARIDPRTRDVTRRVDVEGSPAALVVAEGSLWTAALAPRSSHRGGTLRYESPPFSTCRCVDPAGYDGTSTPVLGTVYDGLVAYRRVEGAAGSALVADLATTVPEPADGGRTYTFQLRSGLRFSNGAPVRVEDFRASIERAIRLAPYPPPFDAIKGAHRCGPRRCDLSAGIEIDPRGRTITIHLRRPDLEFVHKLALSPAWVVPAESPMRIAKRRPLPGTGPYRIAEFDPTRGGRLVRNHFFRPWAPEARPDGFPDQIEVTISDDPAAQVAAVRDGRADAVPTSGVFGAFVPAADLRALAVADAGALRVAPSASVDYAFLNVREPPFDDVRVRRAINYAIDRRRVAEFVGGAAMAGPACQILPPGLPAYQPTCRYTRDPNPGGGWSKPDMAKARRLVAQSASAGSRVDIWAFRGPVDELVNYLRGVLRRLGYRARVRVLPGGADYFAFVADSRNHVQLGLTAWVADFLSPSTFFQSNFTCRGLLPRSSANGNLSQFCEPRVDAAFDQAIASEGPDANRRWAQLDRYIADAAPAVPLTTRRESLLVSDRVGNVQQHLQLGPLLDQIWVR